MFFNNSIVKRDQDDLNIAAKAGNDYEIEIGCVFTELPNSLTVDSGSLTSLRKEHLSYINENGIECLAIKKKFNESKKTHKETTYVRTERNTIKEGIV